jgi:hypothetical protein
VSVELLALVRLLRPARWPSLARNLQETKHNVLCLQAHGRRLSGSNRSPDHRPPLGLLQVQAEILLRARRPGQRAARVSALLPARPARAGGSACHRRVPARQPAGQGLERGARGARRGRGLPEGELFRPQLWGSALFLQGGAQPAVQAGPGQGAGSAGACVCQCAGRCAADRGRARGR